MELTLRSFIAGTRYLDKYGRIWTRESEYFVFNEECGVGGWFGGAGLLEIS